ncbi:pseudaminic acid cytidylyltransferase [Neisseriaceae bacterium CLB008]
MNIAIIPARGGSKRIPHKNIKIFHGKPMIAWSIQAALESGCFDQVIVSTDDPEITAIAQAYGALTPFVRPAELADDYATTADVMAHAVEWLTEYGIQAKHICCLYATAPFVQSNDLIQGLLRLEESGANYAFSAASFSFPIQRAITLMPDARVKMLFPEHMNTRSQDLVEAYHDAGQFYWGTAYAWQAKLPIFSAQSCALVLPRHRVQDIDTPEDWIMAEHLFDTLQRLQALS